MFGFSDTQKQMQDLLLETRSYVNLQKQAMLASTRDKLSVILSKLAIAMVCLLLGGMVLLFFSFFLAYTIGEALGSSALGFLCVTGIVLLLLLIFWMMRSRWVIIPITQLMNAVFTVDNEELKMDKVTEQLHQSRTRMNDNFQQLLHTNQKPANRVEAVSNFASRAFAIYEGMRIGISAMRAFTSIFGRRRRRY